MKRIGNLYHRIYDMENLKLADKKARRGKRYQKGVIIHDRTRDANIMKLHIMLRTKTYRTSPYINYIIKEEKEREISKLPYFPDRICHHAIMNIVKPVFTSTFTADTYSCIEGRGVHKALDKFDKALQDPKNAQYCLQMDIRKFYPSIDHVILKALLRRKFKDKDVLNLFDEVIDSFPGVPLGNLLSQWFGNFYLTYFDHYLKEILKVPYLFRYCDDIILLHSCKKELREIAFKIIEYLSENLKLTVKPNWRIVPVPFSQAGGNGIDFLGYVSFKNHRRLRKRNKKNFAKMLRYRRNDRSIVSYNGLLTHGNCKNLKRKLLNDR